MKIIITNQARLARNNFAAKIPATILKFNRQANLSAKIHWAALSKLRNEQRNELRKTKGAHEHISTSQILS